MNTVGELAYFILNNQKMIEGILVVIALIVAIVVFGKAASARRRRDELISKIDKTVTDINSTVKEMSKSKSGEGKEVIYIDNRNIRQDSEKAEAGIPDVIKAVANTAEEALNQTGHAGLAEANCRAAQGQETEPNCRAARGQETEPNLGTAPNTETQCNCETVDRKQDEQPENKQDDSRNVATAEQKDDSAEAASVKFESRDWSVAKNGRKYTLEELKEQIKQ